MFSRDSLSFREPELVLGLNAHSSANSIISDMSTGWCFFFEGLPSAEFHHLSARRYCA
jgi:hypothetical protein